MALQAYDFEAGIDGATLTAALTQASQVTLNGGTGVFDAAAAQNGSLGAKFTNVAGSAALARFSATAANTTMAFEFAFTAPATPASGMSPTIATLRSATGPSVRIYYDNLNRICFDEATATGFQPAHTGLTPGTKYRLAVLVVVGTSTTGQVRSNLYLDNTTTPIGSQFVTTAFNAGTTAITAADIGIVNNAGTAQTMRFDDIRFNDGSTTEIGPVPVTTVTVTPTSVVDNAGVFSNQGGAASYQAAVADASDTTYVESPSAPANKSITFGIGALASGAVKVTVRARLQPAGGPNTTAKIELLQGTTVIAAGTATSVTDTFADYVLPLTTAQNSAITDRTNLRVRITANQP